MRGWRLWIILLILGAASSALAVRHARMVKVQKAAERKKRYAHNQAEL
jgi:hypothetical protein